MAIKMTKDHPVIQAYVDFKYDTPVPEAVKGFIIRNRLDNKTPEEIDELVSCACEHCHGVLKGEGDRFKEWTERLGRPVPDDDLVLLMNGDPHNARLHILEHVAENPLLYKAYCSYIAGRGRRRV